MGFDCPARQTTADFLTAITDPHERKPAQGLDSALAAQLPSTPEKFEDLYKQSEFYEQTLQHIQDYEAQLGGNVAGDHFIEASRQEKQKHVSVKNPYTITYANQIWAMTTRQVQLTRGDVGSLISRYASVSWKEVNVCWGVDCVNMATNLSIRFPMIDVDQGRSRRNLLLATSYHQFWYGNRVHARHQTHFPHISLLLLFHLCYFL